jgi:hypothetical protein
LANCSSSNNNEAENVRIKSVYNQASAGHKSAASGTPNRIKVPPHLNPFLAQGGVDHFVIGKEEGEEEVDF